MGIVRFFDKLEDKVRGWFSHRPILYGFVSGVGIVLFWRGVWHTTDFISATWIAWHAGSQTIDLTMLPDGLISLVIGSVILLMSGIFVSQFIGNEIIISGLRGEKKLTEKTEVEVKTETGAIGDLQAAIKSIAHRLDVIEGHVAPSASRTKEKKSKE
jgi:hypothetical protein